MSPRRYQPFYCEENVWHLARDPALAERERVVAFVSNARRLVPLWGQRAAPAPEQPVVWDYHVLLFARGAGWRVLDLDTTIGWDVPLAEYFAATFRVVTGEYAPRFRLIDAEDYVASLATDRSHMLDDAGGYRAPPPEWPAIGEGTNVMRFVDFEDDGVPGEVVDAVTLLRRFG